ncbi:Hint domain-containing protein [Pseudooceanicola sp. C21-150M6]|uniref:Hint domain-containing protein n=1 Tax=Pseudooceanicola sp. C21-150M6 TaxID=3434355 RepID=UPI003D7F96D6
MAQLDGTSSNDHLTGGDGDDLINGWDGNDTLFGKDGNDILNGGSGNDLIYGGDGDDTITAGDGFDVVYGGDGADVITGGGDNDQLYGGAGPDRIVINTVGSSGVGNATVYGGSDGEDDDVLDLSGLLSQGYRIVHQVQNPDGNGNGFHGQITLYNSSTDAWANINYFDIEGLIPCFTPGTLIATPRGEVPVESLREGDRVITRDNGIQEIRWLGMKDLAGRELLKAEHLQPVLIQKGSLGYGLPERDMLVSPNHRVLVNNDKTALYFEEREVLVAAKHLTGLAGVNRVETARTTYVHFMFDQHEVVLSDGSWTESFQPGHQTLDGIGSAQRQEILELFPELATVEGREDYHAARRTLKKHEAKLLLK